MSERLDQGDTIRLVLELLRRIPRHRKVTARELHEQLAAAGIHRDVRTIQRQLESLTEIADLERDDRAKPYGYRWKPQAQGWSLPRLGTHESLLLALAAQHLHQLLPASVTQSLAGFFEQSRCNLEPYANAQREREWLSKVRVVSAGQPLLPPRIAEGVFEVVSDALYANQWLELDYQNRRGQRRMVEVMPLGLAQQAQSLYLVGRFRRYEDERSLALHRIHAARALVEQFERPADFDLAAYDDEGRFGFGRGQRIVLSFRIDKHAGAHLLESRLAEDQTVKDLGEVYEITATVVDTAQLDWWLRGFGDKVSGIEKRRVDAAPDTLA